MKTARLATLALGAFLLCSGFVCTGSQIHQVKVANADLSDAINKVTKQVVEMTAQNLITMNEETMVLSHLLPATVISDKITDCTNAVAANTLRGCVTPLLQAVRDDISAASIGFKNPTAQATLKVSLDGALNIVAQIAAQGGK